MTDSLWYLSSLTGGPVPEVVKARNLTVQLQEFPPAIVFKIDL